MSATYRVTHRTTYEYEQPVSASYGKMHLLPRDLAGQRCLDASLTVSPLPSDHRHFADWFGNRVDYVAIDEVHTELTITASSVIEVQPPAGPPLLASRPWEELAATVGHSGGIDDVDAVHYTLDSPMIAAGPEFAAYAAGSFTPGRPAGEAVLDLCHRIHEEFDFQPGETEVDTPLLEVLHGRAGVCQDFAHLGIACLRSLGLPARYVSGYIETDPPPGQEKLVGSDVSHAWFSLLLPGAGWIDVDPTNDQMPGTRHIVTAHGRDYSDVAPVSGVIYTLGRTTKLDVTVDVTALPGS